jgi:hypothetical protein
MVMPGKMMLTPGMMMLVPDLGFACAVPLYRPMAPAAAPALGPLRGTRSTVMSIRQPAMGA